MSDSEDEPKANWNKRKKKKLAIPTELLDDAKSYEEKQSLVRLLADTSKDKMILAVKSLLASDKKDKK